MLLSCFMLFVMKENYQKKNENHTPVCFAAFVFAALNFHVVTSCLLIESLLLVHIVDGIKILRYLKDPKLWE